MPSRMLNVGGGGGGGGGVQRGKGRERNFFSQYPEPYLDFSTYSPRLYLQAAK